MKKKLKVICLLLAMIVLAGCSKKNKSDNTEEEEQKTLVYWTIWEKSSAQGKAIKEAADNYSGETGVKVKVEYKGKEFVRDGFVAALEEDKIIDIVDYDIDYMGANWSELLLDLDEYVEASDYEKTAHKVLIQLAREAGDGNIKAIPYAPTIYAFYYNANLFEQAGIESVPATWDEFVVVCEKLKEAGITPLTSDDEYILSMLGYHLARLVGEDKVREIVEEKDWDNPALLTAVKDYEKLAEYGYFSKYIEDNIAPSGQIAELAGGEAAMYLGSSLMPEEVSTTAGEEFRWGAFSYPSLNSGMNSSKTVQITSKGIGIYSETEYPEEAFGFIEYMTKGEMDLHMSENAGVVPADKSNREWPELLIPARDVFDKADSRLSWASGMESNTFLTERLRENFAKVCGGSMTAAEFIEEMKK